LTITIRQKVFHAKKHKTERHQCEDLQEWSAAPKRAALNSELHKLIIDTWCIKLFCACAWPLN